MNKLMLLGAGTLVMAATSCSNDETVEVPQGNAIGFKTMIDKNVGRAATELTTANLSQFKVWGYAGEQLIFNGQSVGHAEGSWTYTPVQYWEANKLYAFTAVASDNGATCTATYTVAVPTKDQEGDGFGAVAFNNESAAGNEDVVWASQKQDAMATISGTVPAVNLAFKHALSRVKFTFVNSMGTDAYSLTISNVIIDNAMSEGTMTLPGAKWAQTGTSVFDLGFDAPAANILNTKKEATGYQYIIPGTQNLIISFDVTRTVTATNATEIYHHVNVPISLGEGVAYANGHSYNFTATLTPDNIDPENKLQKIKFEASVDPWLNDTENNVTLHEK